MVVYSIFLLLISIVPDKCFSCQSVSREGERHLQFRLANKYLKRLKLTGGISNPFKNKIQTFILELRGGNCTSVSVLLQLV